MTVFLLVGSTEIELVTFAVKARHSSSFRHTIFSLGPLHLAYWSSRPHGIR